ncbi:MAG: isocitrate lyase/PEP mutase family protein [Oceanospirillaceae bacterium]|uniref:isocitrate lyase/PEP mutase family protein n=1 Tax=Salipiger sp. HF18 TaxID=2721557 RepID=UPI00142DD262|nr:isocitrate lyase/PEP mutase family protein [Salipiger sp. HF18]NIY97322.1 isocitrate lyase/PEP mutase family protein [Salipiger sp. HF18]NVK39919.1 isocitrate lyase/PEP mutase family protein [Oceanospirillaceae bacterium]
MTQASTLRSLIAGPGIVSAPGAYDTLTARLVERAGFPAVYMTGFGATVSRLGLPDLGFMTQTEMTAHARDMVRGTSVPIIADADTGYGGVNNLHRTIEEYVQAGVAAVHLEDQVLPKKCGQLGGIRLETPEANVRRLKGALRARGDSEMMIIARTDALGVDGLDAALHRAKAYADAGVDMVFVDGVKTIAQAVTIGRALDFPRVLSIVDGNETAQLSIADAQDMGFSLVFHALSTLFAASHAVANTLASLKAAGTTAGLSSQLDDYATLSDAVDLHRWEEIDATYG